MSENSNPIHPDKITPTPHLLPYAHHVGSAIIKPLDKGKSKGVAMKAMYQQTENQLYRHAQGRRWDLQQSWRNAKL